MQQGDTRLTTDPFFVEKSIADSLYFVATLMREHKIVLAMDGEKFFLVDEEKKTKFNLNDSSLPIRCDQLCCMYQPDNTSHEEMFIAKSLVDMELVGNAQQQKIKSHNLIRQQKLVASVKGKLFALDHQPNQIQLSNRSVIDEQGKPMVLRLLGSGTLSQLKGAFVLACILNSYDALHPAALSKTPQYSDNMYRWPLELNMCRLIIKTLADRQIVPKYNRYHLQIRIFEQTSHDQYSLLDELTSRPFAISPHTIDISRFNGF